MIRTFGTAVAVAASLCATAAFAQNGARPTITVTPTLAPNAFGSPSWDAWTDNSIAAQRAGLTSFGTPGTPTFYQAQSNVTSAQAIVTGFPSWMGVVDPGTVYGPAFANELGNRMTFGLVINGNGTQFSISQLSFTAESSDPGNILGFSFPDGYEYNGDFVGFLRGSDGILFSSDDILVTSGASSQLVDGLISRGSGGSLDAYCPGCSLADQQAALNAAAAQITAPTTYTGTYSIGISRGSGSFNISPSAAVPEPATWAMMIVGFGAVGYAMRRRQRANVQFA